MPCVPFLNFCDDDSTVMLLFPVSGVVVLALGVPPTTRSERLPYERFACGARCVMRPDCPSCAEHPVGCQRSFTCIQTTDFLNTIVVH